FLILLLSVLRGVALWWPLGVAMVPGTGLAIALFPILHLRRGYGLRQLLGYCWQGAKQSWPVFTVVSLRRCLGCCPVREAFSRSASGFMRSGGAAHCLPVRL
ncbi:MAG: hypothetical protein AAFR15_19285, partial [Cyanobacteria bacterium J06627_15]